MIKYKCLGGIPGVLSKVLAIWVKKGGDNRMLEKWFQSQENYIRAVVAIINGDH
jgi:hypothetical protein